MNVGHELVQRLAEHRTAPNNRLFGIEEKADGHHRYAMSYCWSDLESAVNLDFRWLTFDAHDNRHGRSINIGVKQSGCGAMFFQSHRQISRYCGFTDTTLAGGNQHHVFNRRKQICLALACLATAHLRTEAYFKLFDPRNFCQCLLTIRFDGLAQRPSWGGQFNCETDLAVIPHEILHQSQTYNFAMKFRVLYLL